MRLPVVSIIHGARVPFEPPSLDRRWMLELDRRLRERGFPSVHRFQWSGGYLRSFLPRAATRYARELAQLWAVCETGSAVPPRLAIHAKSNGAFVAEAALRILSEERSRCRVDVLLRVATPDHRTDPRIPLVRRVVTIASASDRHYRIGITLRSLFAWGRRVPATDSIQEHVHLALANVRHADFNKPVRLPVLKEGDLFDLYARLLAGEDEPSQITDHVSRL